jgi:hypothetical protein
VEAGGFGRGDAVTVYYNDADPAVCAWARQLIADGLVPEGEVDERSIEDIEPSDLRGFDSCHFFCGILGWPQALQLAGFTESCWTGSPPCQALSSAARGRRVAPDLWPAFQRLIAECRPRVLFGEQVVRGSWIDVFCADMENLDYTVRASILPAVAVGADHARPRFYFACDTHRYGEPGLPVDAEVDRLPRRRSQPRRVVSAHGVSRDVVALAGFGNAIVPALGAEVIRAYMEIR